MFLGNPGYQNGVSEDILCKQINSYKILYPLFLGKVVERNQRSGWYSLLEGKCKSKIEWATRLNFPTAFTAIDCTQNPIVKPGKYGDD